MQYKSKGIVLHEMPIGEHDKRLVVLTKDFGKITVFAKGSRRMNSQTLSCSQLFSYSDMILYKGKTSYNLTSGDLIESYHHLRDDMEKLTYGMFILEFTDFVTFENESNHDLMLLVLKTLKVLEHDEMDLKLASLVFQLKACTYIGYTPWVTDCMRCNESEGPMYFSSKEGGILCSSHLMVDTKAVRLNEGALYTLRYVVGTDMKQLFQFKLDNDTLLIFELVMKQFILYNLNKRFKTMDFLEANINN